MAYASATKSDIAIAGSGYAGLAMAVALDRAFDGEVSICVLGAPPRDIKAVDEPRAFALSAASKAFLDALGIWPTIAGNAQPVLRIELTDSPLDAGVRPVLLTYENLTRDGEPASYIVPAGHLGSALINHLDAARNVRRETSAACTDFLPDDARALISTADGGRHEASLVIAADGRQSDARDRAGIDAVGWRYAQTGIVTAVAHEKPHAGLAVQHFLPAGPFAILPLVGNRSCITWTESSVEAERVMALEDTQFLAEIDRRFGGKLGELRLDGPRRSFPLATHLTRELTADRIALIGDAAHGVHPIAGQGLNLAIRDVAALAECLVDGARVGLDLADSTLLARYTAWRRFDATLSAGVFDGLNRVFANDWPLLRSVREVGLGIVDRLPGLKGLIVNEAAGLTGQTPVLLRGELPSL